ncbi:unnamed protein product [Cyclocybe aegerita]|uniref:Uncharacterized protein n=1 Tax=Cyclocybe aegerita TaxID=1973307 RepID=A0A8S0WI18_CYCAE|nr:unnamed protein product [Cyclocybe aegerita]
MVKYYTVQPGWVHPQRRPPFRPAPFALVDNPTTSSSATPACSGTAHQPIAGETKLVAWSTQKEPSSAPTGSDQQDAPAQPTIPNTSARDADRPLMELRSALELKQHNPGSPYKADAWRWHLEATGLIHQYPTLPSDFEQGFDVGIPAISRTFAPANKSSIDTFSEEYNHNIQIEFERGRYIGPASCAEVEALLGPFQTSPLSVIPKPAKPGKFRLIQNLSYPLKAIDGVTSINSGINSNQFPCTWGTFSVICLLISRLPPGSQAAVRDVKEAYRTIPIKPSQWPGLVVRLRGEDRFAIDTRNCFGLASGAGSYGIVGDAGAQVMRANGIGPLSKPIPRPTPIIDLVAYSDASSEVGIGITIGQKWRAWRLLPGWKANNRDIGWAEATIEESWKDGGKVAAGTGQQTVSSVCKENPADGPSRGEYGTTQDLLPAINIPNHLQHYVVDFDTPHTPTELRLAREGKAALAAPRISPATRLLQRQSTSEGQILHEEEILAHFQASNQAAPLLSRAPKHKWRAIPSTLRPHVFARERLTRWRPTTVRTATDNQGRPTHLSAEDLARILEVMAGAWADGTLEVYGTGLLTWHAFCDKNGVSEDQRAPASPLLITSLIATLSGAFSGGTIANYVYGIRAWHILHGVPWKMVDPELEALLKAAEKATPPTSKRKRTQKISWLLRGQLDLSTPLHAAVYACLTTTFWSAARVGEFTVKNLTSFDANKHVKPSNVTTTTDQNGFETTEFFIPSTKSEPTNGETVSWSRQNGDTDPETAFHNHIDVNSLPNGGHLFAYKVGSGYKPLTKHKFIQILTTAARAAGLEPLQGHGIRIGSTLEYLLRGIPFDVMKAKGRWASDAFLVYLRKHAQILAPYMQADPVRQEEFIRLTMPPLRRH